jgi:EmrB/QacA subfamily drug resistance transporter
MSHRTKVSIVVCLATFMAGLDLFIVNLAFPRIGHDFGGSSLATLSWVLTAYAIVYAALLIPAGLMADRTGRKRLFVIGLLLFTLASMACAAAPVAGVLIAARVVQAIGAGLIIPPSLGLLLPEFSPERRQVAVGLWASAASLAAAAGPPLGGVLTQVSWRLVFLVNVPVGIFAFVAALRVLRESRVPEGPRPDGLGAVMLVGGIGALTLAIVQGPTWGWTSAPVVSALAVALGLAALLTRRSFRHPAPVIDGQLLRVRSFALACAGALLFFLAFSAFLLGNVLFLTGVWHESQLAAGLMIAPAPAMATLVSVRSSSLIQRIGPARAGAVGILLVSLSNLWFLTHVGVEPHYLVALLPGQLLGGAGVGLTIPSLTGAATVTLPPSRFATGTAIVSTARQVGMVLGVAALVAVLGTSTGNVSLIDIRRGWTLVLVATVMASIATLAIGRRPTVAAPGPAPDMAPGATRTVGIVAGENSA